MSCIADIDRRRRPVCPLPKHLRPRYDPSTLSRGTACPSGLSRRFTVGAQAARDLPVISVYTRLRKKYLDVRRVLGSQTRLTLAEKILYGHLDDPEETLLTDTDNGRNVRGRANLRLRPDRVNMQDASAQMALLQFMSCGLDRPAIPASIHCDHLIVGNRGAGEDLASGVNANREVFDFLQSAARRYGMEFWPPGAGIIHQTVLENYAVPGLLMLGTDSHSPNAGGLCNITVGVGGADAVEAMAGAPWELRAPRILGVELTGRLTGWASPKDVILHLAGRLTVRGATGFIIEYFGDGVETLSCTGMATICNMGAEVGATTSIFPYTAASARYLEATRRGGYAAAADALHSYSNPDIPHSQFDLRADEGAAYDERITIDLSSLEPHVNGPFTPDLATPLSKFGAAVREHRWPETLSAALIGSCTNSSYEDMTRVESLVRAADEAGLRPRADFFVTPGSEQIHATLERDGTLATLEDAGGVVLSNACGPCIGQWKRRDGVVKGMPNAIFTSYNRNFRGRNDGNPETMNFLASPELVTAMAYAGATTFNPATDTLETPAGDKFVFPPPSGLEGPSTSYEQGDSVLGPVTGPPDLSVPVIIEPSSSRLAHLEPFEPYPSGEELRGLRVLVKVAGKCTTDTISAAGPWLKYKGHLPNISANTLNTALNAETGEVGSAVDHAEAGGNGSAAAIPELAERWRARGVPWLVVAGDNYGEGSAREHAALQPRYLGARAVLARSFARIHETNLKKQGMVPLTFADPVDYDAIGAGDEVETVGLWEMLNNGGKGEVRLRLRRRADNDGKETGVVEIKTKHTVSRDQAGFIIAGSALNMLASKSGEGA